MKIIIVRHGETEENVKGIRQGSMPGKLTERGKRQAELLGKELKKYKIGAIYSSDRARAVDTAKIISCFHKNVPVITTESMREIGQGIYEGTPRQEMKDALLKSGESRHKWRPDGGESWEDVHKRVKKFVLNIMKKHSNETVLIVGHGRVNSIVMYALTKTPLRLSDKFKVEPNASISVFDIDKNRSAKALMIGHTKHLEGT